MVHSELLALYIDKLHLKAAEIMEEKEISPIEALKEALAYIEGEMQGY